MPLYQQQVQFQAGASKVLELLEAHYIAFETAEPLATQTGHTVPSDTKSWSQVLVSVLTGLMGRKRKKGSDLEDGSDVKGANVWKSIDTPRFNGVLPAGRTSSTSKKSNDVLALDNVPFIFFVLWDTEPVRQLPRCRVWAVRTQHDANFRAMAAKWYALRESGRIVSANFQLHPPRNLNSNAIRNTCGNLSYPLLFSAVREPSGFVQEVLDPTVLVTCECKPS